MDPRFFRQYLDILNEGPPAGVGPNAPVQKTAATTNTQAATPQNPSNWDQAKAAVGQQVQNYKDITADVDAAVKQGGLDPNIAGQAKSQLAGTMMKGGYEAGKAALQGRDPSSAYVGSMIKDVGNLAANSGIDAQMKKIAPDMNQYRGPNAKDIRQTPEFQKASPEQQAQALKDFEAIKNLPDDQWNYMTSGNAFKELGSQAAAAGQGMIDQKDMGKGAASGYSPEVNKAFGLDPTRQATDAEFNAAAKGTTPAPQASAPTQPTAPQASAPTQPTAPAAPAAQPTTPAAPTGQPAPTTPVQEEGEEELQKLKEFLQKRY